MRWMRKGLTVRSGGWGRGWGGEVWESVSIDRLKYGNPTSAIRPYTHSFWNGT